MALVTLVIQDSPEGTVVQVFTEPKMPQPMENKVPTQAQTTAAIALNAILAAQQEAGAKRGELIVPSKEIIKPA